MKNQSSPEKISSSRWWQSLGLSAIALASFMTPIMAQTLYFLYPPIKEPLRVESLDIFVQDGSVNKNLALFLKVAGTSESGQAKFREVLTKKAAVNPRMVSRFFNSKIGEALLERTGKHIQVEGGRNGKFAIRGALVAAAYDTEGLSLINFFRNLPTNIQFDLKEIINTARNTKIVVKATKVFSEEVIPQLSAAEAADAEPVDFDNLPDLRQQGGLGFQQQRWELVDTSRDSIRPDSPGRKFFVDVYRPERLREGQTPVIVISHGLGSSPENFAELAEHLASYGYVIAVPQHIGSDNLQQKDFLEGLSKELFLVDEFINRPLDISYVIDELERRNDSEFDGRLATEKVGVFGHSFGGYTALAVAGATIDFDNLEQECALGLGRINTSLLLQCQALELERQEYDFRDDRIAAVLGHNPVNRSIFGPEGLSQIQVPTMIGAGSYDPATPFVFEQLSSFTWLTSPSKYLLLVEGQAHVDVSAIDGGMSEVIESVEELTLPEPQLLRDYSRSTVLAFAEVYVADNAEYLPYLQSSYLDYLSQGQDFKSYLISEESSDDLVEAIEQFRREERID
ncbi:putative dienelactone hydrolase [Xenococcus sp. PCC 7305]|uniref:alpha/beta hydrolase n=1 Tax=Xenococcus sp. PCC 7305 TaxID=102125 RepID=UPI0002AC9564|nr:alpha/beta hydrolase [Xenococcus sp. PCC 7305]ELS03021.1 putative dienelactone hydrolase [Xenococcus sp. PCC 7305]